MSRGTRTYAILEVSGAAYDEIRQKLEAAGYQHAFHEGGLVDLHGLALQRQTPGGEFAGDARETSAPQDPPKPATTDPEDRTVATDGTLQALG